MKLSIFHRQKARRADARSIGPAGLNFTEQVKNSRLASHPEQGVADQRDRGGDRRHGPGALPGLFGVQSCVMFPEPPDRRGLPVNRASVRGYYKNLPGKETEKIGIFSSTKPLQDWKSVLQYSHLLIFPAAFISVLPDGRDRI